MSVKTEIILIGYSGHGLVIAEAALLSKLNLKFYCEQKEVVINPYNLTFLGNETDHSFSGWHKSYGFILGIGNNTARQEIGSGIIHRNKALLTIIHPDTSVSPFAKIGNGVFISRNASVNPMAVIGNHVILNTGCIVEHGCTLAEAVHVAPGAVLAGDVTIGERSFIGANAVIIQGVNIGKDVTIGAGAVVINDIPDGTTFVGNPSKQIHVRK